MRSRPRIIEKQQTNVRRQNFLFDLERKFNLLDQLLRMLLFGGETSKVYPLSKNL